MQEPDTTSSRSSGKHAADACPLCGGTAHDTLEMIQLADLASEYRRQLGVDILPEFAGHGPSLELRRCGGCGLEFYHPGVAGSAAFYAAVGASQQYYSTTRWEFAETLRRVGSNPDLIDVGCGDGMFLSLVDGARKRGLELNPEAVKKARARGLNVTESLLPAVPSGSADFLTMFQVLEHVDQPAAVLQDTARVLRPGGRLFIAVPNNDAYIGASVHDPLNAPPHHPLRWRADALRYVPRIAPLDLEELLFEALAPEHLFTYRRTWFMQRLGRLTGRRLPLLKVSTGMTWLRRLANLWARFSVAVAPQGPKTPGSGFSVMAVYRRRS